MTVNDVMKQLRELNAAVLYQGFDFGEWERALQDQCDLVSEYEIALRNIGCGPRDCETDQMFSDRASDTARAALIR